MKSVEAERAGLSRSLMESVVDKCRSAVELLTVQYRMNEAIMRFSSDWFYGGRLQAAEEVDDESQHRPPCRGAAEESRDGERRADESSHSLVRDVAARNLEHREEGQEVGDDHDEIGDRKPEDRGEILPQRGFARAVAADLRHGILCEAENADDHHEDAADHPQQRGVLFDLGLEHRIEEQRRHGHESVGAGDAQTRYDPRTAAFRQRALDAEHGYGADGDRCGATHADAAEHNVQKFKSHFRLLRSFQ